ncbi:MAG TPA: DUF4185 domain-containing protein [Candidatus Acidoferrum sp.]|nr:DUF4185 domain-containing protein [Candidatus Acidoferrum sp.]
MIASLGRGEMLGVFAAVGLLFLLHVSPQSVRPQAKGSNLAFEAKPWVEADQFFRKDHLWLGGDVAYSVDLGSGRVLWLFGDSFIASKPNEKRGKAKMVRNSIGIEDGYNPEQSSVKFYWPVVNKQPTEFLSDGGEGWLWPEDGVRLGDKLLLFFVRVRPDSGKDSLGFQLFGWAAFLVENPAAEPSAWMVHRVEVLDNPWHIIVGTAVWRTDSFLYVFGSAEPSHDGYLMRWPISAAASGNLSSPEWWCGPASGWVRQDRIAHAPAAVIPGGSSEFSLQWDSRQNRFLAVESVGFGPSEIAIRWADQLEGPWSPPQKIYRPPESDRPDAFVYAGKGHRELHGADVVITYVANSMKDRVLAEDMNIYYPRFVRLSFQSK